MNLDKLSKFFVAASLLTFVLLLPISPVRAVTPRELQAKVSELESQVSILKAQLASLNNQSAQVGMLVNYGDLTGDGTISLEDFILLRRFVEGGSTLTDAQKSVSDLDRSGTIDVADVFILRRIVVGSAYSGWMPVRWGDLDMNGSVSLTDVVLVSRIANGIIQLDSSEKSLYMRLVGDVNIDGVINGDDVSLVRKFVVGTITKLPVPAQAAPVLTSITPESGVPGAKVTLKGSGFLKDTNYISFETQGGVITSNISALSADGKTLTFYVPLQVKKCGEMYATGCISLPTPAGKYQVGVSNTNGKTGLLSFEVLAKPQVGVTVVYPNTATYLTRDSQVSLQWDGPDKNVNLSFVSATTNGGVAKEYRLASSVGGPTYQWIVGKAFDGYTPVSLPDGGYYFKVCVVNSTICDLSNDYFKIVPVPSSISVVSPNGGETWNLGTEQKITWDGLDKNVDITLEPYYPPCSGTTCPLYPYTIPYTIAKSVAGPSYAWVVGKNIDGRIIPTGVYTMKVCIVNSTTCDSSDLFFKIGDASVVSVTVSSPNGGDRYVVGGTYTLSWSGPALGTYLLELMDASGFGYGGIAQSVSGSASGLNQYVWTIGQVFSPSDSGLVYRSIAPGNYKLHVHTNRNGYGYDDQSDNPFGILSASATSTPTTTPSVI